MNSASGEEANLGNIRSIRLLNLKLANYSVATGYLNSH